MGIWTRRSGDRINFPATASKTQNCTNTPVWHDCVNFPLNAVRLIFLADVFGLLGFTPQFPFACIRVTLLIVCNYLFIIMALTALY